jgi:acetyl-CoA carboxylase biotin carboxyl carrier protein
MKDDDPILLPEDVAEIIAILDGTRYDRLDIKTSRFTLRIARAGTGWTQSWEHSASASEAQSVDTTSADVNQPPAVAEDTGIVAVRAPLPGTFYRAPRPGALPFIEVGAAVEPNTVVGIIETMKVMNSVAAGIAGEIIAIIAENGAPVELDSTLMRVRTNTDPR